MFLLTFYCILGLMTRLQDLIALGFPIAILFITLLSSHLLFAYIGSQLWNKLVTTVFIHNRHSKYLPSIIKRILLAIENNHNTTTTTTGMDEAYMQRYLIDMDSLLIARLVTMIKIYLNINVKYIRSII